MYPLMYPVDIELIGYHYLTQMNEEGQTNAISNKGDTLMETKDLGRLLTCEEVAEALGLRVSTIRRMILERRIDTVRPSRRSVRIPEMAVEKILKSNFRPAILEGSEAREGQ